MPIINFISSKDILKSSRSILWDLGVFISVLSLLWILAQTASDIMAPYEIGDQLLIDLNPAQLPYYAFRTVLRMFIALVLSLLCAFVFGGLAAKSTVAERIILPVVDVLQSIPVIGFLELYFIWLLMIFKGSFLGPEIASILTVFVSQVWNLILAFYQSLKTIPKSYDEMVTIYRFNFWQRFYRLEVPFAAPSLIWNSMLSLSAGWFFVVAGEAITISHHNVALPGIGAYIAEATSQGNYPAIYYALICLFLVIMTYDQLIFRPLNYWLSSRSADHVDPNWVWRIAQHSRVIKFIASIISYLVNHLVLRSFKKRRVTVYGPKHEQVKNAIVMIVLALISVYAASLMWQALPSISLVLVMDLWVLGFYTALRVMSLVLLCAVIWTPVGIWLGLNETWGNRLQPVVQFLASFPPNMLYPLIGSVIISKGYNPDLWLSPLMVLGTQWYVLFNVIAGVRSLPDHAVMLSNALGISRLIMFKRVLLPGILPSLITGMITAAGGAWNASIVAEALEWNGERIYANGLGAYITKASLEGMSDNVFLGVVIMCMYVLLINRLVWMPLYRYVAQRYGVNA
ncbi:ABC transporter permease subunit [Gammaproteobacteria bacterium]|nr:ABC transporter permease subunit [Gammaproteobacteria bacterium]